MPLSHGHHSRGFLGRFLHQVKGTKTSSAPTREVYKVDFKVKKEGSMSKPPNLRNDIAKDTTHGNYALF